jgi:cell division protein FtsB
MKGVAENEQSQTNKQRGVRNMLWTIAVVILVLWLLGFTLLPAAGGLIHILLVIAVIVVVMQLVSGKKL